MNRSVLALALAGISGVLSCLPLGDAVAKPTEVEVVNADPIPVVVATTPGRQVTHMGVAASDHVSLVLGGVGGSTCPTGAGTALRQSPSGIGIGGQFIVPDGKAFVLTDVSIWIGGAAGSAWDIGDAIRFRILGSSTTPIWQIEKYVDQVSTLGRSIWFTESLAGGVVFGPGRICGEATTTNAVLFNSSKLYGYLVDYPTSP